MNNPKFPKIIETPNNFYLDSIDLMSVVKEPKQVEKLSDDLVVVTLKIVASSYTYQTDDPYKYSFKNCQ